MNTSLGRKLKQAWPLVAVVGLLLTLLSWGFASPVGSSPDEDHHLVSIWCANGGLEKMCSEGATSGERVVNEALVRSACFAGKPSSSASCQLKEKIFETTTEVSTSRGNFSGNYPDLFFSAMHAFSSTNIQLSVVVMRFVNAMIFCLLSAALWLLLPHHLRPSLFFTTVLTIVPLGLFLIPSINPGSWAISGVLATFFATIGALQTRERKKRFILWAIAVLGLALAGGARYDALIYTVIGLAAAFMLAKEFAVPRKVFWSSITSVGVALLVAFALGANTIVEKLVGLAGTDGSNADLSFFGVLADNVSKISMLWAGFSGAMNLGWLDTVLPFITWMVAATLLWGSMISRLGQIHGKQLWIGVSLAALLALIPLTVLQASMALVGQNVQSRYLYPLLLAFVGTMLFRKVHESQLFTRAQLVLITGGLFVSQAFAIFVNMARYISGASEAGTPLDLNSAAVSGWWWPVGPLPMTVLVIASLGFGLFLSLSFILGNTGPVNTSPRNNQHIET